MKESAKLLTLLLLWGWNISYAQKSDLLKYTQVVDTMKFNYGKEDYELMRNSLRSDSDFMAMLNKKLESGDTNAVKARQLLETPYELRLVSTGFTQREIDIAIFYFNLSNDIRNKFEELDNSLEELKNDSLDNIEVDSLIQKMKENLETMPKKE